MEARTDTRTADVDLLDAALPVDHLPAVAPQTPPMAMKPNAGAQLEGPAGITIAFLNAGGTVAELRDVLAMHREWEREAADKAFNRAFASFKAETVSIAKTKHVEFRTKVGLTSYDHAELADVVETLTPALSRHGLGCSWKITAQHRDWVEVTCTLKHELGGYDTATLGGPPDESGGKNAIQAISSAITYLERQTMKAVCGVAERGTDSDGRDPSAPPPSDASSESRAPRQQHRPQQDATTAPTGLEAEAEAAVAQGFAAYDRFWNSTGKDNRRALFAGHEQRSEAARRVDQQHAGHAARGDQRQPQQASTGRSRPPAPRAPAPAAHGYR